MRDFCQRSVEVCLVQEAQYATYAHAFLLSFFVTVDNKRLADPTPKRKVARWNRAGGTSFSWGNRTSPPSNAVCPAIFLERLTSTASHRSNQKIDLKSVYL